MRLVFVAEPSFEELISTFQVALYRHYSKGGDSLYNPTTMRDFAQLHSPGLFDTILKSVTRDDHRLSEERNKLHLQRTVAILHIFSYFR